MGETKKRKSGMVRVRGGFSDVQGIAPCNTEIQMEEFDDVTRNKLCNILYNVLEVIFNDPNEVVDKPVNRDDFQLSFCKSIIGNVFCETYSQGIPAYCTWRDIYSRIQSVILESEYNEVLDVIQYVCQWVYSHIDKYRGVAYEVVNDVFEEETVGIRIEGAKKKTRTTSTVFERLLAAGQRLLAVISHNEGGANKDLAKFADQINSLCDKWDR